MCGAPGNIGKSGVTMWVRSWIREKPPSATGLASGPAPGVAASCCSALPDVWVATPSAVAAPAAPSWPTNRRRLTACSTVAMTAGEHMIVTPRSRGHTEPASGCPWASSIIPRAGERATRVTRTPLWAIDGVSPACSRVIGYGHRRSGPADGDRLQVLDTHRDATGRRRVPARSGHLHPRQQAAAEDRLER
jgi:hypothetical protein